MHLRHLALSLAVLACPALSQLSGPYTVYPLLPTGGTNFASLLDAVTALNTQGVSGPVTFDLFDDFGPFIETHPFTTANVSYAPTANAVLTLGQWAGSSPANRVTFRAAPGESPVFDATGKGMGVFWNGADYVTLEGIEILNAIYDGVSFYSEASHGQVFGAVVRRCRIHDCGGAGVVLYGNSSRPQNTLIENNWFWRLQLTNAGGFNTLGRFGYISGRRHDFSRVVHNTFHVSTAVGSAFCVIGDVPSGGTGSHFAEVSNNIIVKTAGGTFPVYSFPDNPAGTNGVPATLDAHCYLDTSGGTFSTGSVAAPTFAAWQAASGRDANSIGADPILVNPAAGDLHLGAGSPCVNLSAVPAGVVDDIDGELRIGVADVGADEITLCTPALFETNDTASSLLLDGVAGTTCTGAVVTKTAGTPGVLSLLGNIGFGWEGIVSVAPLVPLYNGAIPTPGGQLLNVSFAAPVIFLNGGFLPNFGIPFPGSAALGFTTPPGPLTLSFQMVNIDPVHTDGFSVSQASQLVVP